MVKDKRNKAAKRMTLVTIAKDLNMGLVAIRRQDRARTWRFIATNLERLRPCGFDGRMVICCPKNVREFADLGGEIVVLS